MVLSAFIKYWCLAWNEGWSFLHIMHGVPQLAISSAVVELRVAGTGTIRLTGSSQPIKRAAASTRFQINFTGP